MPFTFHDRFQPTPGPLDPRFQGTIVTPTVSTPTFSMISVRNLVVTRASDVLNSNITVSRTELTNLIVVGG